MKERPIIFSGEMVQAILKGRKTQTRRIIKFETCDINDLVRNKSDCEKFPYQDGWFLCDPDKEGNNIKNVRELYCPFGIPGDHLWVRECFSIANDEKGFPYLIYKSNAIPDDSGERCGWWFNELFFPLVKWRPSIHMPRGASRITLEIVNVRVERLQEISGKDCYKEGCLRGAYPEAKKWFENLWNKIHGHSAWESNPWVWVIEFKRI